jgi:hypothetical protein
MRQSSKEFKYLLSGSGKGIVLGGVLGLFIGLTLLVFVFQFYLDLQLLLLGARDKNILIVNKQVRGAQAKKFSKEELLSFQNEKFVQDLAPIQSNQFEVWADLSRIGVKSLLFFQSVPNRFLEIDTLQFNWNLSDTTLPIVLSADYLALYNFGFSASQGLPQLSGDILSAVDFEIQVSGNGKQKRYKARIIGFTQQVNSVLVPQKFLAYHNKELGKASEVLPTQLIFTTENPYSNELNQFLEKNEWELSSNGIIGSELKLALFMVLAMVGIISILIIILAILVFVMNFQVLISQKSSNIHLLLQLGYQIRQVSSFFAKRISVILIFTFISSTAVLVILKYKLSEMLFQQGFKQMDPAPSYLVLLFIGLLFFVILTINLIFINKNIKKLFSHEGNSI